MKYAATLFFCLTFALSASADEVESEQKTAIQERIKEVRTRQEPFALELEAMLGPDTKLTLFSLDPHEDERWFFSGKKNGVDVLRGYPILGKVVLTERKEIELIVRSLVTGIRDSDGAVANCFLPHHGLTIERGEKKVDLVVCFMCRQGLGFGVYASDQFLTTDEPQSTFTTLVQRYKIPGTKKEAALPKQPAS